MTRNAIVHGLNLHGLCRVPFIRIHTYNAQLTGSFCASYFCVHSIPFIPCAPYVYRCNVLRRSGRIQTSIPLDIPAVFSKLDNDCYCCCFIVVKLGNNCGRELYNILLLFSVGFAVNVFHCLLNYGL